MLRALWSPGAIALALLLAGPASPAELPAAPALTRRKVVVSFLLSAGALPHSLSVSFHCGSVENPHALLPLALEGSGSPRYGCAEPAAHASLRACGAGNHCVHVGI